MTFAASDVVPLSQARATLSELAEQVKAGAEKIITKNGKSLSPSLTPNALTTTTDWNTSAFICSLSTMPAKGWTTS